MANLVRVFFPHGQPHRPDRGAGGASRLSREAQGTPMPDFFVERVLIPAMMVACLLLISWL